MNDNMVYNLSYVHACIMLNKYQDWNKLLRDISAWNMYFLNMIKKNWSSLHRQVSANRPKRVMSGF